MGAVAAADAGTQERRPGPEPRRAQLAASRMPSWMGSIRFRLAVVYSSVLFGLAAIVVSVIYIALATQLNNEVLYLERPAARVTQTPTGAIIIEQGVQREELRSFEHDVNATALTTLRRFSFSALLALFLASLAVGWVVAGRALAPIERITAVAEEIQATDLSRRIDLGGPHDELRHLADTFDDMLDRIDGAFEEQKRFIHEASHELRNPLAVIRTNLDVTLADPDASEEELRQTLAVVQRSSERMSRLVDDLLMYARKGSTVREMVPLDLSSLVTDAGDEFRVPAETRRLTIDVAATPGLHVVGDPVALKQALANLLANAVRLAPEGSTLRVTAGSADRWAWMAVADEGPGIAAGDQERVFQRFYRGDGPAARGQVRSGLGLTIVRQIAEAHGGEVRLVSTPGVGSTFAVWLPLAPADGRDGVRHDPSETSVTSDVSLASPGL